MAISSLARPVSQILCGLAVVVAVVPFGAVDRVPLDLSVLTIAFAAAVGAPAPVENARARQAWRAALALGLFLAALVVAQSLAFRGNPLAHSIWQSAANLIPLASGAVSVDPAESLFGLPALLSPFLMFMACLSAFQGDGGGLRLWRLLGGFGGAVGIFGLAQFVAFPGTLFGLDFPPARDVLGAVFVNRNDAATFLGMTSLLVAGLLLNERAGLRRLAAIDIVLGTRGVPAGTRVRVGFLLVLFVTTLVALFLTNSRGGLVSTLVGYLFLIFALIAAAGDPTVRAAQRLGARRGLFRWRKVALALIGAGVVLGIFVLYGGQTLLRFEGTESEGRACVLPGILQAIGDNWLLGTGFGTFDRVFPAYRDPSCGIYGSWFEAHNSFLEGYLGLGVIFVPIVAVAYWVLGRTLARGIIERQSLRFAPAIGAAILVVMTLHSLVDFPIQIQGVRTFFAAAMAASVALASGRSLERPRRTEARHPRRPEVATGLAVGQGAERA